MELSNSYKLILGIVPFASIVIGGWLCKAIPDSSIIAKLLSSIFLIVITLLNNNLYFLLIFIPIILALFKILFLSPKNLKQLTNIASTSEEDIEKMRYIRNGLGF